MFEQMPVLIAQMEMFASLILIGFVAQKLKLLSDENINNLSAILSKFIIPAMLVTMIPNGGTRDELLSGWVFLLCSVGVVTIMLAVGTITSRMLHFESAARRNMHAIAVSFGNAGFIGIPLISAVFPETSAIPCALYLLVEAIVCWTLGPIMADPNHGQKKVDLKKLVSPLTISIAIGTVLILLNINLEGFILWDTLTTVGGTTKYFASIYVGLNLGRQGFKKILIDKRVFASTPFKLIVFPIAAYLLFGKTGILSGDLLLILVLFAATPTGMAISILADMTGSDTEYATAGTLVNTVFCLVTIPLVMQLISYL